MEQLSVFPESGRRPEELPPEYREWLIQFGRSAYVVLYRYREPEILITAVRHSREAGHRIEVPSKYSH